MRTVAEGIERRSDAEWLRDRGCDVGQGFLYSKPLPASEIEPLLARASQAA